ncbi:MAG TPA: class I SAM-dependent methyltransferase, partial [Verrucomicrobiae bacterium]|nr:class I SAM-dependent methyltransferase [Verrucomicrobiae bacterium]
AKRYANFRPHYPAALFDYLATLVPQTATVWDCAAGSGQATLDLARRFAKVIATDASAEQIASATPLSNVDYRVALAEESGLPANSVDLITVAQALHWFRLDQFFAEARRVLKPGGVLSVWVYATNQFENQAVNQIVQDFYLNVVGPYWPPERKLTETGYRGIVFPLQELSTPFFRMQARWALDQLLGYFSTWSATNRFIKANGRNPIEPLAEALAKVWGDTHSPQLVVWPLALRVGVNRDPKSDRRAD